MRDIATPILLIGTLAGVSTSFFVSLARAPFWVGKVHLALVAQLLLVAAVVCPGSFHHPSLTGGAPGARGAARGADSALDLLSAVGAASVARLRL